MRKLLAITLTMMMLFSMTAMAEDENKATISTIGGVSSAEVKATYKAGVDGGTIYSVDIVWGSLEYTYNAANAGTWDPSTHVYIGTAEAGWTCVDGEDKISVTNHSNAEINVSINYENAEGVENIEGTIDNKSFTLPSAENKSVGDSELTNFAKLTVSGELDPSYETMTKVGTVTVTITGNESSSGGEDDTTSEEFEVTSIDVTNTEIDSETPFVIVVNGNNFDESAKDEILNRITLFFSAKKRYLKVNSQHINATLLSDKCINVQINKEYFDEYFSNTSHEINITEIMYSDLDNEQQVVYNAEEIIITNN